MKQSDIYGINVPERGDNADISVVSTAIDLVEDLSAGKIEYCEAFLNASDVIELNSAANLSCIMV